MYEYLIKNIFSLDICRFYKLWFSMFSDPMQTCSGAYDCSSSHNCDIVTRRITLQHFYNLKMSQSVHHKMSQSVHHKMTQRFMVID